MKYIIIRKKRDLTYGTTKDQARATAIEYMTQYPTPANLISALNIPDVLVVDSSNFSADIPAHGNNDCIFQIAVNDDQTQYEYARIITEEEKTIGNLSSMQDDLIFWRPTNKTKENKIIKVALINYEDKQKDALVANVAMKQKLTDSVTEINKELSVTLDVQSNPNLDQNIFDFVVMGCDVENAFSSKKTSEFISNLPFNRPETILLVPTNNSLAGTHETTRKQIEKFAQGNNGQPIATYAPGFAAKNWQERLEHFAGIEVQIKKDWQNATITASDATKLALAEQEIEKLVGKLGGELNSNCLLRLFTDFNSTKFTKHAQLNGLLQKIKSKEIASFADLQVAANELKSNEVVVFTSWPLTSRSATLLDDITLNNGDLLSEKYTLDKPSIQLGMTL